MSIVLWRLRQAEDHAEVGLPECLLANISEALIPTVSPSMPLTCSSLGWCLS
jgi:hypothetical protein